MPETKIEIVAATQAAEAAMRRFEGFMGGMLGRLTAAFSIGAVATFGKRLIDVADGLNKMKQRTGESVAWLSTFRYAAKLADVDLGALQVSLKTAAQQLVNAADGGRDARKVFDDLGIGFKNTDGSIKGLSQLIADVADRFAEMPDGVEKTDAAVALFGRSGQDLIPLLNQGSAGLKKVQDEARRMGLQLSGLTAQQADDFNDNMTAIKETLDGLGNRVLVQLLPKMVAFSDELARAGQNAEDAEEKAHVLVLLLKGIAHAVTAASFGLTNLARVFSLLPGAAQIFITTIGTTLPKAFEDWIAGMKQSLVKVAEFFQTFGTLAQAFGHVWKREWIQAAGAFDKFGTDLKTKLDAVFAKNETASPWSAIFEGLKLAFNSTKEFWNLQWNDIVSSAQTYTKIVEAIWATHDSRTKPETKDKTKTGGAGRSAGDRESATTVSGNIGIALAAAERAAARIAADATQTQLEKKRQLLPILDEENALLLEQVKILEYLRGLAKTDAERLQVDQQLDAITAKRDQLREQVRELGSDNFAEETRRGLAALADEWGNVGQNIAQRALDGIRSAVQGVGDAIMGAIDGTKTWGQVFSQVGKQIISQLIQVAVNWIAQMTIIEGIKTLFQTKESVKRKAELPEKAVDAALTSTGSYGVAAILGAAALAAILALALSAAFASGGLVGGQGSDTSDNVVAALSPGEYVVRAAAVRAHGLEFMERVNNPSLATPSGGFGGGGGMGQPQVHVVYLYDEQQLRRFLESRAGEQIVLSHVSNNKNRLGIQS